MQSIKHNFENLKGLLEEREQKKKKKNQKNEKNQYNVFQKHDIQILNYKTIRIFKLNLESFSDKILFVLLWLFP